MVKLALYGKVEILIDKKIPNDTKVNLVWQGFTLHYRDIWQDNGKRRIGLYRINC